VSPPLVVGEVVGDEAVLLLGPVFDASAATNSCWVGIFAILGSAVKNDDALNVAAFAYEAFIGRTDKADDTGVGSSHVRHEAISLTSGCT
jgi:hypothetical protein